MKKRLLFNFFAVLSAVIFMVLFLLYPDAGRTGAGNGLLLCGRVVIPSLFPFTACMLFLTRRKLFDRMTFMTPLTNRIFHLSGEAFGIF
ncbi:MAG: hypothetical protein IJT66_02255, partial [Clostridia bacterium]|nr:hypothetical protein [Clostridia bacterium]